MIPSDSVCDYDDYFYDGQHDDCSDYYDYDDPDDYDSFPNVYGFIGPDDYELYHDLHGLMVVGYIVLLGALLTLICRTGAKTEGLMCHTGVIM